MVSVVSTVSLGKLYGQSDANCSFDISYQFILTLPLVVFCVGTLSPDTDSEIPTVTDNLFSDGTISADEIGVSFVTYHQLFW